MTISKRSRLPGAIALVLFTLLLWLYPLLTLRLPHQNDIWIHLRWADQFLAALQEGWLLPRWASASVSGLGDPTFLYYQPLFYYITSAFSLIGLRAGYALLCAAIVPYLLLGGVVYFHVLARYRNRGALLGALFVLACPIVYFLSVNMASFPWTLSLPFSVLFVAESTRQKPRPTLLGILLCLVCLSHLLSAMIALFCTAGARLVLDFPNRHNLAPHIRWALGVVLGLALAAFFIFPAVTQLHLINPDGWTDGPIFDWRRAFAFPTYSFAKYGLRWFAIQWPLAVVALLLAAMVIMDAKSAVSTPGQAQARRFAVVAMAALALSSELAYPLYAMLPPLQKLQFPYRFVFLGLLLANIAFVVHLNEGAWQRWAALGRAAAVLLIASQLAMAAYIQWGIYRSGESLPDRAVFMKGHFGQPEYLPAVRGPDWKAYSHSGKLAGECRRLRIHCVETVQRTHDFSTVIETDHPVSVRLPLFAYPAWRIAVDGVAQSLVADPATGLPLVALGPGRHRVTMRWSRTAAEQIGWWISAVAVCILCAAFGGARLRRHTAAAPDLRSYALSGQ